VLLFEMLFSIFKLVMPLLFLVFRQFGRYSTT